VLTCRWIGTDKDGCESIAVDEFARQMAELAKLRDSGAVEVVIFKDGVDRFRQLGATGNVQYKKTGKPFRIEIATGFAARPTLDDATSRFP
jgi:hypothetical protein